MQTLRKLRAVYSLTDGIFLRLRSKQDIPWGSDTGLANKLDLLYLYNHSGDRYVAPILDLTDTELTTAYKDSVIDAVWSMYKNKWTRLWELNTAEYNPLENYSMTETHTGTETDTETPDNWKETETQTPNNWKESHEHKASNDYKETETQTPDHWKSETDHTNTNYKETEVQTPDEWERETVHSNTDYTETETQTPDEWKKTTQSLEANNDSNTTTSVYGFNSSTAVPSSETETTINSKTEEEQTGEFTTAKTITGSQTDTETQSGTFTTEKSITGSQKDITEQSGTYETTRELTGTLYDDITKTGTYKTETERTGTYEKQREYNTELTRTGNIGTVTAQDMAEQEISLWKWLYFEDVFKDIDNILTLDTY